MRPALSLLACSVVLVAAPVFANDDAKSAASTEDGTQRLDSPLGVGTGATFSASKSKDSLVVSLAGQTARGLIWQTSVEGAVEDKESASVVSLGDGFTPGVGFKLGVGIGSFEAGPDPDYVMACKGFMAEVTLRRRVEQDALCKKQVEALAEQFGKGKDTVSVSCAASAIRLAGELHIGTANEDASLSDLTPAARAALSETLGSAILRATPDTPLSASVAQPSTSPIERRIVEERQDEQTALSQLDPTTRAALLKNAKVAQGAKKIEELKPGTKAADKDKKTIEVLSCNEVGTEAKESWVKDLYKKTVLVHDIGVQYRLMINLLGAVKQSSYRAQDASGQYDLKTKEAATAFLPGVSLDLAAYYRALIGGLGVGYNRSTDPTLVEICNVTTVGTYIARDCTKASLGKPKVGNELFVTAAFQINPITRAFGNVVPGVEVFARISSKDTDAELLSSHSWTGLVSLPIFLAGADAPNGLRAGFAPELTIPTKTDDKTDLALLLFVGTRFRAIQPQ